MAMASVLILDDSPVVRKIARRILESMDFKVSEASDANQALAASALMMLDAVLVDGNLPEVDGFEFVRRLRRLPGGDRTRIVFCLSENSVAQMARATHAGADEILLKPFDPDLVRSKFEGLAGYGAGVIRSPASRL
jgi:two-component system chemotaxis response regulator CheY